MSTDLKQAILLEAGFRAFWASWGSIAILDGVLGQLYRSVYVKTAATDRAERDVKNSALKKGLGYEQAA